MLVQDDVGVVDADRSPMHYSPDTWDPCDLSIATEYSYGEWYRPVEFVQLKDDGVNLVTRSRAVVGVPSDVRAVGDLNLGNSGAALDDHVAGA